MFTRIHGFCYDNENEPPAPPTPPEQPKFDPEKITGDFSSDSDDVVTLSQKQLGDIVGRVRKQFRTQTENLASQMQEFTDKLDMSEQERERVNTLLKQSRSDYETKLGNTEKQLNELKKQLTNVEEASKQQIAAWQKRYEAALIDQTVSAACEEAGVYRPAQMRDLLDRHLQVKEKVDAEGKGTGVFNVVVPRQNEKGESVDLPVLDYLKQLDESGEHPNLFTHGFKDGVHSTNGTKGGGTNKPPTDPTELAKWLDNDENRAAFYKTKVR